MGGAFILARQIFTSQIWQDKPSSWKIIWIYILGQVNHADNGKFKRGEGFFNFKREIKDIGCDITYDMIRHSMAWFKGQTMIGTSRSTRGITIKVLNYAKYQALENYTSTSSSTSKAQEKHIESTPINNKTNKTKNDNNVNTLQAEPAGIAPLMKEFEELNPTLNYGNTTQRKACKELIEKFGLEKTIATLNYYKTIRNQKFSPVITTPYQLQQKMGELLTFYNKEQSKSKITIL